MVCMLYANFYAVRKMGLYATEVYLYDKLLVAYNIGGMNGLQAELKSVLADDKMPYELKKARDFEVEFSRLDDPVAFLNERSAQLKSKIKFLRNLRTAAICVMVLIFGWQMAANMLEKRRRTGKI